MSVEFPRECTKCQERTTWGHEYCPECGTKITSVAVGKSLKQQALILLGDLRNSAAATYSHEMRSSGYPKFCETNTAAMFDFIKTFMLNSEEEGHE